jgi:phospholipid transport system substrate-binding protein
MRIARSSGKAAVLALLLLQALSPERAFGLPPSGGDAVRAFYATLLGTMKDGRALGRSGRYARLDPVVRRTFDIPFMARLTVGPSWAGIGDDRRQQVTAAFARYIAAVYADRFDSFAGEQLQVGGEQPAAAGTLVRSHIVKSDGESIAIDYLMRQNGNAWQIGDVYLDGSISQLATYRSEFAAILRDRGIDGLIAALNRKADLLVAERTS